MPNFITGLFRASIELVILGRSYASKAYAIDENDFEALRWMAILIGSATDFMGPKEKIEQGKIFKAYLDRAIDQQPNEYSLLHSRGRFTFEIANLSWLEKKLCNTLFSRIPDTNINDALADFLEAEKYAPFIWPENLLYVTRCYVILKQRELALKYLHKVETMQNLDDAETEALMEVRCAVAKLK
ncbi:unnamed protein product [Thelazia callipaeda]|uniref:Regulator of microtubule dynamics protein 1 n=1 Tax=Thelazia callipaeda TaxID=103827 RepID=A0A0N5CT12_THECL|nr:unnamed protein product [Thelazia callipaeda]